MDIERPVIKSAQQEQRAAVHRGHTHAVCCSCLASSVDKGLSPGCCFETSKAEKGARRGGVGCSANYGRKHTRETRNPMGLGCNSNVPATAVSFSCLLARVVFLVLRSALLLPLPGLFLLQRCQAQLGRGS